MAKGEIAHDEQFLLWLQCFQLYLTIEISFMEIFQVLNVNMFSKSSAADLLYVGKGLLIYIALFEWCFMPLSTVFQLYYVVSRVNNQY